YHYVVHSNSDAFTWSGKLTDDKITLPAGAASFSVGPGQDATFDASATINGTVTNTATASGALNDPASTSASSTATATVTEHVCTISLTKPPSATDVCTSKSVTYTYVVHNNSDAFTWSGKLTDDKNGTIADPLSLAPNESKTFTASANISGDVTNTATASGAFNDPASTSTATPASPTLHDHVCP